MAVLAAVMAAVMAAVLLIPVATWLAVVEFVCKHVGEWAGLSCRSRSEYDDAGPTFISNNAHGVVCGAVSNFPLSHA